jgi:hypothetical protein
MEVGVRKSKSKYEKSLEEPIKILRWLHHSLLNNTLRNILVY